MEVKNVKKIGDKIQFEEFSIIEKTEQEINNALSGIEERIKIFEDHIKEFKIEKNQLIQYKELLNAK